MPTSPVRIVTLKGSTRVSDYNRPRVVVSPQGAVLWGGQDQVHTLDVTGAAQVVVGTGATGFAGDGGPAVAAAISRPTGLAYDPDGNLYVADAGHDVVRRVSRADGTISTYAGRYAPGAGAYKGDAGPATQADLKGPLGLAFDGYGNLFVADTGADAVRMVGRDGVITTAVPATWGLRRPEGVAYDTRTDTLYVVDTGNHRILRKARGQEATVFAGGNGAGRSGDGGPAPKAALNAPTSVAVDRDGSVFVADTGNHLIRCIGPDGVIRTFAGNGTDVADPGDLDGTGNRNPTDVALAQPTGVALDAEGNLYVANHDKFALRRIERPAFAAAHQPAYDFGTKPFSVVAIVSPGLLRKDGTAVTGTGTIVAKEVAHQDHVAGWRLRLVTDPPGQPAGTYLSFATRGVWAQPREEVLARIDLATLTGLAGLGAGLLAPSEDLFRRSTHVVAVVRDASGASRIFLDGYPLVSTSTRSGSGAVDVSSKGPLTVGRLRAPDAEGEGTVRKVALWNRALSADEVVDFGHALQNPRINFFSATDYALDYAASAPAKQTYGVAISGTMRLRTAKQEYSEPISGTRAFTPPEPCAATKLPVARKLYTVTEKDVGNFTWKVDWKDPKVTRADLTATHKAFGANPEKSATDTVDYPEVKDPAKDHQTLWAQARQAASERLLARARAAEPGLDLTIDRSDANAWFFSAPRRVWLEKDCVGFWTLRGRAPEGEVGKDLSPTGNDLPPEQRWAAEDLDTILPFVMQKQQQSNWCWASASMSVAAFYGLGRSTVRSQGAVLTDRGRDLSWSLEWDQFARPLPADRTVEADPGRYDFGYNPRSGLAAFGMTGTFVADPTADLRRLLHDGRVVPVNIGWKGGGGHIVVVSGLSTDPVTKQDKVVVNDPSSGVTEMELKTFLTGYLGSGSVQYGWNTAPVWTSTQGA